MEENRLMNSLRSLTALLALLFVVGISAAYADGINGRGDGDRNADVTSHVTATADVNAHSLATVGHEPVNGIRDGYALRVAMWQSHNADDAGTPSIATPEQPTLLLLVAGVSAVFFLRRRALES
jgi:hypothetical protein